MKTRLFFSKYSSKGFRRSKPHPNTNKEAWDRAYKEGRKGGPKKMSSLYHKYAREDEIQQSKSSRKHSTNWSTSISKRSSKHARTTRKYVPKDTILDDLRECRSSKTISAVSNSFAMVFLRTTGKKLSNDKKNILRAIIALATSETLNKVFEKELTTIDRIQTFVKVGKFVYKVTLWYNEQLSACETDNQHIERVSKFSSSYKNFLIKHPVLNNLYSSPQCPSAEKIKSGQKCFIKEKLDIFYDNSPNAVFDVTDSCPYYPYCHDQF